MRNSPIYLAAVADLARAAESLSAPSFEIENCAAGIASDHGVDDADVREDVAAATLRLADAKPVFAFTDTHGVDHQIQPADDDFFVVCIGGVQIGSHCGTPQEAEKLVSEHLDDGVQADLVTVEAWRQGANDDSPVESSPRYRDGRWAA